MVFGLSLLVLIDSVVAEQGKKSVPTTLEKKNENIDWLIVIYSI
jgi:hypothetical protein